MTSCQRKTAAFCESARRLQKNFEIPFILEDTPMILPATTDRVPMNSSLGANRRIEEQTEANINRHRHSTHGEITRRIRELEQEWDIERVLEANAAGVVLLGVGLGMLVDRRFFAVPGIVAGFLMQHALQGWCPPLPLFREWGVRTQAEIDREIYALKAIRGDFRRVDGAKSAGAAMDAVVR
jgi:hypothetical protein